MMTARQLLESKRAGEPVPRPLFCPAIYEHKARLIGRSVSEVARDSNLLAEAVLAEYETYRPDMLTVGMDIYNIEAEAIGSRVVYSDQKEAVPAIRHRLLQNAADVDRLAPVDVARAGRMPTLVEAAARVHKALGKEVLVRGAVSGPFSIAAGLLGVEKLILEMVLNPEAFGRLIDYCADVSLRYGLAFIERGLSVCLFDSESSPPLVSPDLYRRHLLGRMDGLHAAFKEKGCEFTEYVIGGTTDEIAVMMLETGFDIVLSDFSADPERMLGRTRPGQLIRRNIDPRLFEQEDIGPLDRDIRETVRLTRRNDNVIIGTGVLSWQVAPERIIYAKNQCEAVFRED